MDKETRAMNLLSELGSLMNPSPSLDGNATQLILNQLEKLQKSIDEIKSSKLVYTTKEVMELLNFPTTDRVDQLRRSGLLIGFKSGHGYMFTQDSINRFLQDIEGKDISNKEKVNIVATMVKQKKKGSLRG